jgi:hypothetical protein
LTMVQVEAPWKQQTAGRAAFHGHVAALRAIVGGAEPENALR